MSEKQTITGVAEKISEDRRAIYIADERYSAFRPAVPDDIEEGMNVVVTFKTKGKFKDLISVKAAGDAAPRARSAAPGRAADGGEREARIVRQNALAHATALVTRGSVELESLFYAADVIADYALDGDVGKATDALATLVPQPQAVAAPPKSLRAVKAAATVTGEDSWPDDFDAPGNAA